MTINEYERNFIFENDIILNTQYDDDKIIDYIKSSFKIGRKYYFKLRDGRKVRLCVYNSHYSSNVRIIYMIRSDKGVIYADSSLNILSQEMKEKLYEIAHDLFLRKLRRCRIFKAAGAVYKIKSFNKKTAKKR